VLAQAVTDVLAVVTALAPIVMQATVTATDDPGTIVTTLTLFATFITIFTIISYDFAVLLMEVLLFR
jgi:hypothetical protein